MSDFLSVITPNTNLSVSDFDGRGPGTSTDLSTGDIRRRYNFGSRVSELAIPQDPFFRFVSKVAKKPVDDPQFKFSEKRPSFHKRYAYVMGYVQNDGADEFADDTIEAYNDGGTGSSVAVGDSLKLYMAGDYKSAGNVQNVYGNTSNKIDVGASGTTPKFFLPGQIIKIPTHADSANDAGAQWGKSYMLARITAVDADSFSGSAKDSKYPAVVECKVVKAPDSSYVGYAGYVNNNFGPGAAAGDEAVSDQSIASTLERARTYVVGSAHMEGSGFPETWLDQPYSSNHGLTQIWKTSMAMTNRARATVLKFEPNEWARVWKDKLIEHKWDIETSLLFGSQYEDGTGGALSYVAGHDQAQATGFLKIITTGLGNDNDQSCAGELHLFDPASTTFVKHFYSRGTAAHKEDLTQDVFVAGYCNVTAAIDGVQFKMSSGNIDAGVIKMYGVS